MPLYKNTQNKQRASKSNYPSIETTIPHRHWKDTGWYTKLRNPCMFPHVEKLLCLLPVSPAYSWEAERPFSVLQRIKTWLRSTMPHKRLNHGMVCHVHRDRLRAVNRSLKSSSISAPTLVPWWLGRFEIVRLVIMLMIYKIVAIYTIVVVHD